MKNPSARNKIANDRVRFGPVGPRTGLTECPKIFERGPFSSTLNARAKSIGRRRHWIDEIARISRKFGEDIVRVERALSEEINQEGFAALFDHLHLCGAIPEEYRHDTSEEKLYSKYTDAPLAEAFRYIGLTSIVLTERIDPTLQCHLRFVQWLFLAMISGDWTVTRQVSQPSSGVAGKLIESEPLRGNNAHAEFFLLPRCQRPYSVSNNTLTLPQSEALRHWKPPHGR